MIAEKQKASVVVMSIVVLTAMSLVANAVPLFDVNFNSDSLGDHPAVADANAGQVNTHPTDLVGAAGGGFGVWTHDQTSYPAFSTFGDTAFAVLVDPSETFYPGIKFWGHPDDAMTSGQVKVSFDLIIDSTVTRQGQMPIYAKDNNGNALCQIAFCLDNLDVRFAEYSAPGVMSSYFDTGTLVTDTTMFVEIMFDMDAGRLVMWIDGDPVGSISIPTTSNLARFEVISGAYTLGNTGIDNFVTEVGEPIPDGSDYPMWDVDFDSMNPDQPPETAGAVAGITSTKPSSCVVNALNNEILVRNTFSTSGGSLDTNPVVMYHVDTGPGTSPELRFRGTAADVNVGTNFKVDLDFLMPDPCLAATVFAIHLYSDDMTVLGFFALVSDGRAYLWNRAIGSTYISNVWDPAAEEVLHLAFLFNAAENILVGKVDDARLSIPISEPEEKQGVREFRISLGSSTVAKTVAVDNIVTSTWQDAADCQELWLNGQGMAADFNQDCYVNVDDLLLFVQQWLVSIDPAD
jgi:hypothetical protein